MTWQFDSLAFKETGGSILTVGSVSDGQVLQRSGTSMIGASGVGNFGTSRLTFVSTTSIQLGLGVIPLKASGVWVSRPITAAITVANTGLAANTTYFVYAFDNAGVTTLDPPSTTGHSTDTTFGVETKTGDATRTLVGMIRTQGSTPGQFEDDNALRGVISYFSRRGIGLVNNFTVNRSTTSATFVELNTEIRANFITWSDEAVIATGVHTALVSIVSNGLVSIGFDGATAENAVTDHTSASLQDSGSPTIYKTGLTEGFHFATLLGAVDSGATLTLYGGTGVNRTSTLTVYIRG